MSTFEVRLQAQGPPSYDESLVDAFYSAHDGLIAWHEQRIFITLGFESADAEVTCKELIRSIEESLHIEIVEADLDLVDIPEIARRVNRSRQNVQQLVTGKRHRRAPAPTPLSTIGGKRIWDWGTVVSWLKSEGLLDDEEPEYLTRDQLFALNAWIGRRRAVSRASMRGWSGVTRVAIETLASRPNPVRFSVLWHDRPRVVIVRTATENPLHEATHTARGAMR